MGTGTYLLDEYVIDMKFSNDPIDELPPGCRGYIYGLYPVSNPILKRSIVSSPASSNSTNLPTDTPRRARLDRMTAAEIAIYNSMQEVEKVGADVLLTEAIILLSQARDKVADFVDKQPYPYDLYK